jgi:hypothetical protein
MRVEYGPLEAVGVDFDGVTKLLRDALYVSVSGWLWSPGWVGGTYSRLSDPLADFLPADYCTACGGEGGAHRLMCPVAPKENG